VLLQDMMWDLFENTGNIAVYLVYRQCLADGIHPESRAVKNE